MTGWEKVRKELSIGNCDDAFGQPPGWFAPLFVLTFSLSWHIHYSPTNLLPSADHHHASKLPSMVTMPASYHDQWWPPIRELPLYHQCMICFYANHFCANQTTHDGVWCKHKSRRHTFLTILKIACVHGWILSIPFLLHTISSSHTRNLNRWCEK
jgi:hypothetical protein